MTKFTIEEQLAVKKSIVEEFNLTGKKVTQSSLDIVDAKPDSKNPDHWDFLLYSKEKEVYINLKFFPRITIEPIHTDNYNLGVIYYTEGMDISIINWYIHNILDRK